MKSLIRFVFSLIAALVAVVVTFVVLFFTMPSWQEGILRTVMKEDPEQRWTVERILLRPSAIELDRFFYLGHGVGVELGTLRLQTPWWRALLSGHLDVKSGLIDGFMVDLSQMSPERLQAGDISEWLTDGTFDDTFWQTRLQMLLSRVEGRGQSFRLEDVTLRGQVLLPRDYVIPVQLYIEVADSRDREALEVAVLPQ